MRLLITRTTVADGRVVRAGNVEDISDRDAALLLQLGKAVETVEVEVTEAEAAPAEAEAPKRRGRKRAAE